MTWLTLIRRNLWRKPLRSVLLILCVATTFLIHGLTASFLNGAQGAAASGDDILGVTHAAGMGQPLPLAHEARIASVEGVAAIAPVARLRGFVQSERNAVALSATEPGRLMAVSGPGLGVTPDLIAALEAGRDRVLVGRALAEAQGWQVGQSMTLTAFQPLRAGGGRDLRLTIAGIFPGAAPGVDTYFMIGQYRYLNALRDRNRDTADVFALRPDAGVDPAALAARIDAALAHSAAPTRTQSERQFLQAFLRQYADVGLIVTLVTGASTVTLLMIVINTMVFAVRERRFEIGVLKTLGFSRSGIGLLILAETLFVFALGGALGLGLTQLATMLAGDGIGLVLSPRIAAEGAAMVLALALLSGLLPAALTMRIPVTAAFRTR